MDATRAPITASVTMAAPGIIATETSEPKCFRAKMYANVGDLESVSMTRVRLVRSPSANAFLLAIHNAIAPPSADRRHDGSRIDTNANVNANDVFPADAVVTAAVVVVDNDTIEFEEPPATRTSVESTPMVGRNRETFCVKKFDDASSDLCGLSCVGVGASWKFLEMADPANRGTKTKDTMDFRTPLPSTATEQPRRSCTRNGVASTPRSVVEIVQITERATSPPASKVNKLDAWPPLTEPSNIKPIAAPPDDDPHNPILAMPAASSGITPKHNRALMERSFGWRHKALVRSFGVMERPIANMRIAYAVCITDNDPTTFEHHEAFQTANPAASIVQRGVKRVNRDNLFSRALLLCRPLSFS